jgi:hypothetical protein
MNYLSAGSVGGVVQAAALICGAEETEVNYVGWWIVISEHDGN